MRAPTSWPNHLPETELLNAITSGIGISIYTFGRDTNTQTVAVEISKKQNKTKENFKICLMVESKNQNIVWLYF